MKKFDDFGLTDQVNILIASDHGMTDVSESKSINLDDYINFNEDIMWSYTSAIGLLIPKENKTEQVGL